MEEYREYNRISKAEMRPVTEIDIEEFKSEGHIYVNVDSDFDVEVSISKEDISGGSPRIGDYIARNPTNHRDQWLVSEEYAKNNFRLIIGR